MKFTASGCSLFHHVREALVRLPQRFAAPARLIGHRTENVTVVNLLGPQSSGEGSQNVCFAAPTSKSSSVMTAAISPAQSVPYVAKPPVSGDGVVTGTVKLDEAREQRRTDKMEAAKQALKQALAALKRSAARPNDETKTRAREKLESIRQRLQQLRMMGGTPRQIAALAKELKEAVKAYGAAGGSSAEAGVSPADTAQPTEAVSADAAPSDATQDGAEPTTTPVAPPGADAEKPASSTEGRDPERPAENPYDKAIAANAERVAAAARKSAEGQADQDFIKIGRAHV